MVDANHSLISGVRFGAAMVGIVLTLCLGLPHARAAEDSGSHATAAAFPVASNVRVAGDARQTRFILDLDHKIDVRAFTLADPYRVVLDIPQVRFDLPARVGDASRGLIKAFRYGLVMPGGSRVVMDLAQPARIEKAYVLDAGKGQPAKLVVELSAVDRAAFLKTISTQSAASEPPASSDPEQAATEKSAAADTDSRPVIVLDPGHGGIDNGTQGPGGETEKSIVLDFATALRNRLEAEGKFRIVMTRADDTFVPLGERVRIARSQSAALFVSIHADALPKGEGDAQGATFYTLSDKASDAEAEKLADSENRADAIAGVNLTEEPTDVADILIDLAQRETKTFSNRFARLLVNELKGTVRLHKKPLKSAGFRVLKAPDVPSVLIELGYVSNRDDLRLLVSDSWRSKTVGSVAQAIETYFARRVVTKAADLREAVADRK